MKYTSDWDGPFDGHTLSHAGLEAAGYRLFPWEICSENPWWKRPLKYGEIGCTLAHLAAWQDAARSGSEPYVLVLEDDAVVGPTFVADLTAALDILGARDVFDLLYLGRVPLTADRPACDGSSRPDTAIAPSATCSPGPA